MKKLCPRCEKNYRKVFKSGKLFAYCTPCASERAIKKYRTNQEYKNYIKNYRRKYYKEHPEKVAKWLLTWAKKQLKKYVKQSK